jgi:hypothetical protein
VMVSGWFWQRNCGQRLGQQEQGLLWRSAMPV